MTEQQAKEQAIHKDENSTVDNLAITTIRTLAIDAIEKPSPAIRVCRWVPLRWVINSSQRR